MAIKVNGTTVINDSRALSNIASVDATTAASITAAGVGAGGTAPTSGTTYEVVWPFEPSNLAWYSFYGNTYMTSPYGTRVSSSDGFNIALIGLTAGTVKVRANMRVASSSNRAYYRVLKNSTQVSEHYTNSTSFNDVTDTDVTYVAGDLIEVQFKVLLSGQDAYVKSLKFLSGTNAVGCLMASPRMNIS